MNRILSIIKKILHPTVFTILLFIVMGFVILYFGQRLGMRGIYPLKAQNVREFVAWGLWIVAGLWTLFCAVRWLYRKWRASKTPTEKRELTNLELETKAMGDIFSAITKKIRKKWAGTTGSKYGLPWYVVLGKQNAGKTSLIDNVDLRFPIDHEISAELKQFEKFEASEFVSWRVSGNDAVILDLQGEFFIPHEERTEVQNRLWDSFLDALNKYRPRRPINGVVLAIDAVDFFHMTLVQREDYALLVRRSIGDLVEKLGTRLPVYVVFTKLDLIAGFSEYYELLNAAEREQLLGYHFVYRKGSNQDWQEQFAVQQNEFLETIGSKINSDLLKITPAAARREAYTFYRTFFGMESPMSAFLEASLSSDKFSTPPVVRGVYFTSVRQENAPESVFYEAVGDRYAVPAPLYGTAQGSSHPYFVTGLFSRVIFPEAGIAGANIRVERVNRNRGIIAAIGSGMACLALGIFWNGKYNQNLEDARFVDEKVAQYVEADVKSLAGNQSEFLEPLNTIRDATQAFGNYRDKNLLVSTATLYQGKRVGPIADKAYLSALNEIFVPSLVKDVEVELKDVCPKGSDQELELLRVYRSFGELGARDKGVITRYHEKMWQAKFEGDGDVQDYLNGHLNYALEYTPQLYEISQNLVSKSQKNLSGVQPYKRVYSSTKSEADRQLTNAVSFPIAAGASFDLVYTERTESNNADDDASVGLNSTVSSDCDTVIVENVSTVPFSVPEFYTKDSFFNYFIPKNDAVEISTANDLWVLGAFKSASYSDADFKKIKSNILNIYVDDYIQNWRDELNNLQVHEFKDLRDAIEVTKVLGSADNPIKSIANLVAENTNIFVDDADITSDAAGDVNLAPDENFEAGMEIKRAFFEIQQILKAPSDQQPAKVVEMIEANAAVYQYLKQIQDAADPAAKALEMAIERAELKGDDPIYVLKRIADQMPAPFDEHLKRVADGAWRAVLRQAAVALNAKWQNEIYGEYQRQIAGKYPFDTSSNQDLPIEDFQKFFAPGGTLDFFYRNELLVFVDEVSGKPKPIDGEVLAVNPEFVSDMIQGNEITQNFFDTSGNVYVSFEVTPVSMSKSVLRSVLNVEGQIISYAHGPAQQATIVWPNVVDGLAESRVDMSPTSKSGRSYAVKASGTWSWLRLSETAKIINKSSNAVDLSFNAGSDQWVILNFRSENYVNPFVDSPLANFSLPENLNATSSTINPLLGLEAKNNEGLPENGEKVE